MMKQPIDFDILELLPQKPPFIMVDKLTYYDPTIAKTTFKICSNNLFCSDGKMEESALIENIAQTCAARMGYKERTEPQREGTIKIGYIGMIKTMNISRNPRVGEELTTTVEFVEDVFQTSLVQTKVEVGNEVLATCEMKIFLTDVNA